MTTTSSERLALLAQRLDRVVAAVDVDAAREGPSSPLAWFALDVIHVRAAVADLIPDRTLTTGKGDVPRPVGDLLRECEALTYPLPTDIPGSSVVVAALVELVRAGEQLGF